MIDVVSQILNVLLLVIALALIGIVVIQRNEGGLGGLGGGTGGGGMGGLMTGRAAANLLTKMTRWLAIGFFGVTLALAYIASERAAPPSLTTQPQEQGPAVPVESGGTTAPATTGSAPASGTSESTTGGTSGTSGGTTGSAPAAPTTNQ